MATQKKSTRGKTAPSANEESAQAQAERMSRHLGESVHEIWLAGIGALGRAQAEGSKLFESLVKEGESLERSTRKRAGGRVDAMREMFDHTVEQARERAADTWDTLGKAFEQRVHRVLRQLDMPSREDIDQLHRRIDALSPAKETTSKRGASKATTAKTTTTAKKAAKTTARPTAGKTRSSG